MLCFLDESGHTRNPDPNEVFVLAGVALPVTSWGVLDTEVDRLKSEYGLQRQEIHATHLYAEYRTQASIGGFDRLSWEARRSAVREAWQREAANEKNSKSRHVGGDRHRNREAYIHLTREERVRFLKQLCGLLVGFKGIYVAVEACSVVGRGPNPDAAWLIAFEQVVGVFQRYLV